MLSVCWTVQVTSAVSVLNSPGDKCCQRVFDSPGDKCCQLVLDRPGDKCYQYVLDTVGDKRYQRVGQCKCCQCVGQSR